jgi:hypothetical protein
MARGSKGGGRREAAALAWESWNGLPTRASAAAAAAVWQAAAAARAWSANPPPVSPPPCRQEDGIMLTQLDLGCERVCMRVCATKHVVVSRNGQPSTASFKGYSTVSSAGLSSCRRPAGRG